MLTFTFLEWRSQHTQATLCLRLRFALLWKLPTAQLFQGHELWVPPSRSPAHLAGPEPGSAPRCSAGWPSPPPPESRSARTRTADAGLEANRHELKCSVCVKLEFACQQLLQSLLIPQRADLRSIESLQLLILVPEINIGSHTGGS